LTLAQSSIVTPAASATVARWGTALMRRSRGPSAVGGIGFPKPICSKIMCGESRRDMLAYSSMKNESTRRWSTSNAYGSTSLMKPGLLPVA
jgi:hypothetical protein